MRPEPKRQRTHETESTSECSICCEPVCNLSSACTLRPCGHVFHAACIWTWAIGEAVASKVPTCPLCRGAFSGCNHTEIQPPVETQSLVMSLFPAMFVHGQHVCAASFSCLAAECRRLSEDLQITQDDTLARQMTVQAESLRFDFPVTAQESLIWASLQAMFRPTADDQ
jgi:hypothetical protein